MYIEDLATRSGDPDDFLIDGYEGHFYLDHAQYAHQIDQRIDIEQVMRKTAEKYQDSPAHLAALCYITTNVALEDAAALVGRSGSKTAWWLTSIVKPMREELCELFGLSRPGKTTWQEKLQAGEDAPLKGLIEQHEQAGNDAMSTTLRHLAERKNTRALMERLDIPKTHAHYLRRMAHQELNRAYGCRV